MAGGGGGHKALVVSSGGQAPLTSPCPPSNYIKPLEQPGLAMPAMLIGLNIIHQISFMAAFATSLLSILDPNTHSNPPAEFLKPLFLLCSCFTVLNVCARACVCVCVCLA